VRAVAAAFAVLLLGAAPAIGTTCRPLTVLSGGRPVVGMEDIAVDAATGLVVLSAYDRRSATTQGGLYRLDPGRGETEDLTAEFARTQPFRPHGIDLLAGTDGATHLFAINHRPDRGTAVELFDLTDGMLHHHRTIESPLLCQANDIAALGPDRFLFTGDHGSCGELGVALENIFALDRSFVGLFDGQRARVVITGIAFANGILADPAADRLYVAATRDDAVLIYRLSEALAADAPLTAPLGRLPTPGGPDNLSRAVDGRILAAVLPSLLRLALHRYGWPGGATAPSRIVALTPGDGMEILFDDDGRRLSAATVAADVAGYRLIGSVTADHLMVCRDDADAPIRSSGPAAR
jgi:arylesterase/paraoxonase